MPYTSAFFLHTLFNLQHMMPNSLNEEIVYYFWCRPSTLLFSSVSSLVVLPSLMLLEVVISSLSRVFRAWAAPLKQGALGVRGMYPGRENVQIETRDAESARDTKNINLCSGARKVGKNIRWTGLYWWLEINKESVSKTNWKRNQYRGRGRQINPQRA